MESQQQVETQQQSQKPTDEKKVVERLPYKTYREYYEDSYRFTSNGKVLDIWKTDKENEFAVVLDKTIFHPQGGGQPADDGTLTSQDQQVVFTVKALQAKDDAILHIGSFAKDGDSFSKDQEVYQQINEVNRKLYARFHSAGHLLDMAMKRVGQNHLQPGKGYHFTSGAYVEYIGNVDNGVKDKLPQELTKAANDIIKEQSEAVWSQILPYEEANKVLKEGVPPYIPQGQDLRVVKLTPDDEGCPCGGTHVKHVLDINEIEVTKIVKKGKNTRVSYTVK